MNLNPLVYGGWGNYTNTRYKIVKTFGGSLEMINVKPSIRKVFEMSGVLKIVPIRKDINLNVS